MITPDMAKPGPKPKDPSKVRSVPVGLRVTPELSDLMQQVRRHLDTSVNDWAHTVLLREAKKILRKKQK